MGVDFGDELRELGHEVRLFPYRRDNALYKNTPTKAAYQRWILRKLERACAEWRPAVALAGRRYAYRGRLVRDLADYPLRVWGGGWTRAADADVRRVVAGGAVFGHAKLCVYSGSTVSLNPHHPMNDIVGVNTRAFE